MPSRACPILQNKNIYNSWFLVGTRSFYYETEETLSYPSHDRLALLPVADVFNHASAGCSVAFSTEAYDITADRAYQASEEVCTSHGTRSNDFLLAEYGFVLPDNPWDQLCLDKILLAKLPPQHMTALSERDLLGDFMLRADLPPGDRTWVECEGLPVVVACQNGTTGCMAEKTLMGLWPKPARCCRGYSQSFTGTLRNIAVESRSYVQDDANAAKMDVLLQRWNQLDELARANGMAKQKSRGKDTKNKFQ